MSLYFLFIFALMAFFLLFVGGKVVLDKKPMFINSRYFFAFIVLSFSPQFVLTVTALTEGTPGGLDLINYLSSVVFVIVLVYLWFQMKGYMAIGISDKTFREALHFSLNKNNLPFEEQISVFKLTSIKADLQVANQSWVGAGQIKISNTKDTKILPELINGINEYCLQNSIKTNNATAISYILVGLCFLAVAGTFFVDFH